MSLKILNEGFNKRYIKESSLQEKELSSVKGSASNSLVNWWNGYDSYGKSVKEIYNDLQNAIPEDKKTEPKVKKLLMRVMQSRKPEAAMMAIGNFVLAGEDQRSIPSKKYYESYRRIYERLDNAAEDSIQQDLYDAFEKVLGQSPGSVKLVVDNDSAGSTFQVWIRDPDASKLDDKSMYQVRRYLNRSLDPMKVELYNIDSKSMRGGIVLFMSFRDTSGGDNLGGLYHESYRRNIRKSIKK